MQRVWRDVVTAGRSLRRTPITTMAILLSLGLGIGGVASAAAWYEGWVLRPIPQAAAQGRLVWLNTRAPGGGTWSVSYPTSQDWQAQSRTLSGITLFSATRLGLRETEGTEHVSAMLVGANYFDLLGVRPMLGRGFHADEERGVAPVVVLGHAYWTRRFDADPGILGRRLTLNGHDFTVVGVAPPRFGGSHTGLTFDAYLPVTTVALVAREGAARLRDRSSQWLEGFGRLAPGVTLQQARAEAEAIGARLEDVHPGGAQTPVLTPLQDTGASNVLRPVLVALLGVTGLVLLVACANVANLLLARGAARHRELAVRMAVGAGRGRIVRQLLMESLLLSIGGGILGLLMAHWGRNALIVLAPPAPFPIGMDLALSPTVLLVTAAVTLLALLLSGLLPALRASRPALMPALREGGGGGPAGARLRGVLVSAQVALCLTALVSAGLFLRGLQRAGQVDPGYADPDRLLLFTTDLQLGGLGDSVAGPATLDRILERLRTLPGITSVATAHFVPLGFGGNSSSGTTVEGYTPAADENMSLQYSVVTHGYFATVGMPIVQGRSLAETDRADSPPVVVVNEAFVRRFLPGRDPIGHRIRQAGQWMEIVGVAQDAKYQRLDEVAYPFLYLPISQRFRPDLHLHLRTEGDPLPLVETIRRELFAVAPDLPFLDPRTMTQQMVPATFVQRVGAAVLGLFGILALVLAAIGLYGVIAYAVTQRTREIGVRVALGAGLGSVVLLVVGQGLRVTGLGLLVGTALALGLGRLLRGQLFGVNPADPLTFLSLGALLAAVAVLASLVPARRAARVDPVVALRSE